MTAIAGQNFDQLFQHLTVDHADFGALTVDCIEFQLLTVDNVHIYRRMHGNSTPSSVYGVKMRSCSCEYRVYESDTPGIEVVHVTSWPCFLNKTPLQKDGALYGECINMSSYIASSKSINVYC